MAELEALSAWWQKQVTRAGVPSDCEASDYYGLLGWEAHELETDRRGVMLVRRVKSALVGIEVGG